MSGTTSFAALARHDLLLLFLILSGYFLFLLPDIRLPSINNEEAAAGRITLDILRSEPGRIPWACETHMSTCLSVPVSGGRLLPVMWAEYESALPVYILIPFSLFFGVNLLSLRLMSIALAFVSLIYLYLLLRQWLGRRITLAALALIISNPVFVIYHKMSISVDTVYLACFFWAGLYYFYAYYLSAKRWHLAAAAFCVGLGLEKVTFLWYIAGVLLAAVVLRKRLARKNPIKPKDLLFALPAFCAGNFFMLYYNLRNGFKTVSFMYSNLVKPTQCGANNLDFAVSLKLRFHQLVDSINGRRIGQGIGGDDSFSPNALIFAAAILLLVFSARMIDPQRRKKLVFLAAIFSAVYVCSHFTLTFFKPEHLYTLYFVPPILTAAALFFLKEAVPYKRTAVCVAGILMAAMLAANIAGAAYDIRDLRKTGGRGRFSPAIPALASWLEENGINDPVIVYNMDPTIPFLTKGKVQVIERTYHSMPGEFGRLLKGLSSRGTDIYFVTAEDIDDYLNKEEFNEYLASASSHGHEISVVKVFNDRSGRPELVLHKIARQRGRAQRPRR